MAIAYVGGATNSTASSVNTLSGTYSPTAGNEVVVALAQGNGLSLAGAVCEDNNGNALTLRLTPTTNLAGAWMFYGTAQAGATSYTCTWTTARAQTSIAVAEYSGVQGIGTQPAKSGTINATALKTNVAYIGFATDPGFSWGQTGALSVSAVTNTGVNTASATENHASLLASNGIATSYTITNSVETSGSVVTLTYTPTQFWGSTDFAFFSGLTIATWLNNLFLPAAGQTSTTFASTDPTAHGTSASQADTGTAIDCFIGYSLTHANIAGTADTGTVTQAVGTIQVGYNQSYTKWYIQTQSSQANSFIVTAFSTGAGNSTATNGTIRQQTNPGGGFAGVCIMDNTSASPSAAVVISANLFNSNVAYGPSIEFLATAPPSTGAPGYCMPVFFIGSKSG